MIVNKIKLILSAKKVVVKFTVNQMLVDMEVGVSGVMSDAQQSLILTVEGMNR